MDSVAWFTSAGLLVHLAAGTQVVGYLVRDQLALRLLLLAGTLLYIAYYIFYPATPLWDAALWSLVMAVANTLLIVLLLRERTGWAMSPDEHLLFNAFQPLSPGQFRRLMKAGTIRTAERDLLITVEGEHPERLYYVLEGEVLILKGGRLFDYPPGAFIGELAFVTGRPATATVKVSPGARYMVWECETLERLVERHPAMLPALNRLLVRDMAEKISRS